MGAGRRTAAALALALCLGSPAKVRACGHCLEDKVAATYDYAVLTRAARDGHVVVFTEILGPAAGAGPALEAFITRTLAATPGIDAGTVRVSLDPPAASFACDPGRHAPSAMLNAINPGLATKGLRLKLMKIDRGRQSK